MALDGEHKIMLYGRGYVPIKELGDQYVYLAGAVSGRSIRSKIYNAGVEKTLRLNFSKIGSIYCTPDQKLMTADGEAVEACEALGKRIRGWRNPAPLSSFDMTWMKLGYAQAKAEYTGMMYNILDFDVTFKVEDKNLALLFDADPDGTVTIEDAVPMLRLYGFSDKPATGRPFPLRIPNDKLTSFLKGYFTPRGNTLAIAQTTRVYILIRSEQGVRWLKEKLATLGIKSSIQFQRGGISRGGYKVPDAWKLWIMDYPSMCRFYEQIGFLNERKMNTLERVLKRRAYKITMIEAAGEREVYKIAMADEHWAVVDGFNIHNEVV